MTRPYWVSDQKIVAYLLLTGTLILGGATKGGSVAISFVNRDMMTALADRNAAEFFHKVLLILLYSLVAAPIIAIDGYVAGKLIIHWRQWLTEHFLARTFRDRAFYRISSDPAIDNPDQRISEDLNTFAGFAVTFVLQVFWGLVTGVSFIVILWLISPSLAGVLVAYVVAGSLLTIVIGRPLIGINFTQRQREADFRHALVHLRNNAEAIGLYGGEESEEKHLLQRLYAVVQNYNLLILWQRNLAFFTYTYDLLLVLVPVFVLAPSYFRGTIAFGQIAQAGIAFLALRVALSVIVDQYNALSTFVAVVQRLGSYMEAGESQQAPKITGVEAEERLAYEAGERPTQIETLEGPHLAFAALTLRTPDNRKTLIRELSYEIGRHERLLIVGESGVGKTSLLRAIAGLWRTGSGRIVRPPLAQMMFLPQRPYTMLGSFRDQLCYPHAGKIGDAALVAILKEVNLEDLPDRVGGFGTDVNGKDMLSLGEQQELAIARVLLNHPAWAFLDEATSAVDFATEELLYEKLIAAQIMIVSVGNRPALRRHHDTILELLGDGAWRISEADSCITA